MKAAAFLETLVPYPPGQRNALYSFSPKLYVYLDEINVLLTASSD
jgi:hypothetical protein